MISAWSTERLLLNDVEILIGPFIHRHVVPADSNLKVDSRPTSESGRLRQFGPGLSPSQSVVSTKGSLSLYFAEHDLA